MQHLDREILVQIELQANGELRDLWVVGLSQESPTLLQDCNIVSAPVIQNE